MPYQIGDVIGSRYVLMRAIAKSTDGALFEAQHRHTKRRVALKLLDGSSAKDPHAIGKLMREAELLTQARHRAVVEVLDADGGKTPYIATEMLDGRGLDGVLAVRKKLTLRHAFQVVLALADALGRIHELGLIHGSLSPSSMFLPTPRDSRPGDNDAPAAKLLDFGMSPSPSAIVEGALAAMPYAASDRLGSNALAPYVDTHALAAVAFECLTGELPVADGVTSPSASALDPDIPEPLSAVLVRALGSERYADGRAMASALRDAYAKAPPRADAPSPHRRETPRSTYATAVLVIKSEGRAIEGRSEDISEGGMLVVTPTRFEARERVNLTFALPLGFELVTIPAVTRWTKPFGDGAQAIGFQFIDPPGDVLEDIREYVAFFGGAIV